MGGEHNKPNGTANAMVVWDSFLGRAVACGEGVDKQGEVGPEF